MFAVRQNFLLFCLPILLCFLRKLNRRWMQCDVFLQIYLQVFPLSRRLHVCSFPSIDILLLDPPVILYMFQSVWSAVSMLPSYASFLISITLFFIRVVSKLRSMCWVSCFLVFPSVTISILYEVLQVIILYSSSVWFDSGVGDFSIWILYTVM